MSKKPVIAVFDVGKTNKKLFLFDEHYRIVYEKSARFIETVDEDGDPCENLESLRLSVFDSLSEVLRKEEFDIKALNFSTYGASFVYVGEDGLPVAPLYNYLKPYPDNLLKQFYNTYDGEEEFAKSTSSPVLGSLNSGMQLYRIKHEKPELFKKIKYALHLPQYLSYLVTGKVFTDITSIGCHTNLWDFQKNDYHRWVYEEGIAEKFAPILPGDQVLETAFQGHAFKVGAGLHDSSAALIPYLENFHEPFILLSTGTWCISLNPFNSNPLTLEELKQDSLCYMNYKGTPVKASRLFAGYEHEQEAKRIAEHFAIGSSSFKTVKYNPEYIARLKAKLPQGDDIRFADRDLSVFENSTEAYHQLIMDIVKQQEKSTKLAIQDSGVRRIFVDGGFGNNDIFMHLIANAFPGEELFAASMAQATAMGTAIAIHKSWNRTPISGNIIELRFYPRSAEEIA
ncbi:Carbohydrate kinase, FGGY [Pseudopedobacter saltans DSM 12145]|uniref:Carbohydrate kinase, FGGY n=1 Tax=Pseudopedobacter saltans (strain ATCC 51119 / DSM 12145 / JCM 21818 / CCUG 39354 / LMG 10337 / NBRC 100064 / NCIMB 13643) TaxID=762903 RepID=F0S6H3_PSESL|nr:FGGY family carbohydrate kinase [Pseudopedobacter saltans]ADY54299.1 Carbohydrate kinase, FGGY [Pseudopedobacter saltans DSM 12145]